MIYTLDEEEKNVLLLLETAKAEGSFNKNAHAYETKYSDCNIHYKITFFHRNVYCKIDFYSKSGTFSFCVDDYSLYVHGNTIEKKYCTIKSHFFGLIKETLLDVNHPIVAASLNIHKMIMQKAEQKETLKIQKTWDKLLSES
jgi:hypothetical protein